jgi:putative PIN family toxin of toxin-antitoxin system
MRIVIDTDVLLSGLRSPTGASRMILTGVLERSLTPLINTGILLEYEAVLKRAENMAWTGLQLAEVDDLLDFWADCAEHVSRRSASRASVKDPNDAMFADAALTGRADALVTFNIKDYARSDDPRHQLAVDVVRPGDFVRRLTWRPSSTSQFVFRLR